MARKPQLSEHHKHYTGIRNGLWTWEHIQRLGPALGLFGWCISRQTTQNGSSGLVFGGEPVLLERICEDLEGAPPRTVQRWLQILRQQNYVETTWTPRGIVIRVLNAKKERWAQPRLFEATPEVASHATNSHDKDGVAPDKSGVAHGSVLSHVNEVGKQELHKRSAPLAFTGKHVKVTEGQDKLLAEAFPWVDRQREYRVMDSWHEANPKKRPKSISRFAHNWMSKIPPPREGRNRAEERTNRNLAALRLNN